METVSVYSHRFSEIVLGIMLGTDWYMKCNNIVLFLITHVSCLLVKIARFGCVQLKNNAQHILESHPKCVQSRFTDWI